jgi:hypothetical protein
VLSSVSPHLVKRPAKLGIGVKPEHPLMVAERLGHDHRLEGILAPVPHVRRQALQGRIQDPHVRPSPDLRDRRWIQACPQAQRLFSASYSTQTAWQGTSDDTGT